MSEFSDRLLDFDPHTGVKTIFRPSVDGETFQIITEQDVEPILELNKEKQKAGREYYARDKDLWRVASIPASVQLKWLVEKGVDLMNPDHWPEVKKLLNDPEWKYLKTAEVTI